MADYLIAHNPTSELKEKYIIRMTAPLTFIAIRNMDSEGPVTHKEYISKHYDRQIEGKTEVIQLVAMPVNDGISSFHLQSLAELEWILDDAWAWYIKLK